MEKTFQRDELETFGLPYEPTEGVEIVADVIVEHKRWSVVHQLTFRLPSQAAGEAWRVRYSVGATEYQDERPWEYDKTVDAVLVRAVEKTVTVWEVVEY